MVSHTITLVWMEVELPCTKTLTKKGAHLIFTSNTATGRGGAIFVEEDNLKLRTFCFFQYLDPNPLPLTVIYFSGNEAGIAGSVVFGGRIDDFFQSFQVVSLNMDKLLIILSTTQNRQAPQSYHLILLKSVSVRTVHQTALWRL